MFRKALILLLSATLAIPLLLFLSGCGQGDASEANSYIERGDFYADKLPTESNDLEAALRAFFTTLSGPNPESVGEPGGPLDKYYSALYVSIWLAKNVNTEYKRVLELKDTKDQKTYADMMIKITDKTLALMDFIKVWFGKALNVIVTKNPTRIKDYLTGEEFTDGQKQITVVTDEIDRLAKEATDYRQGKNF